MRIEFKSMIFVYSEPRYKGVAGREVGEQEVGLPRAEGSYWGMEREETRRVD